jgi:hypothetical protein
MQTLNLTKLTPVQDCPGREDHKCVVKSDMKKKKRKRKLKKGPTAIN